tara:strand:- start:1099 stop:1533 length:435 start_codon:yes stop_codon:yes gene_type:complete
MTVYGGTQKITMGRDGDTDYKSKLAAAKAQASPNSYVQGVQSVMDDGAGVAVANTRTKYGNVNVMPQDVIQGSNSNFSINDAPGNSPLDDLPNQTGSIQTQVSSTNVPQEDPEEMETDALSSRLEKMARGGQGFPGLNNRNQEA